MGRLKTTLKFILSIVTKNRYVFLLIAIASFLRLYRFGEFVTFLGDQGRDATIIKRILTLQHFPAIGPPTSIGQVYLGPFYYYLMTPFLLIARFEPVGLALGVAFLSIVGLIFSYFIARKFIGEIGGLLFLSLLTFSSTLIDFSRFSWNPNLLPLFSFLTLFFFFKLTKENNIFFAILAGSFLSFSLQLHYLGALLIVPIVTYFLTKRYHLKNLGKKLLYSILAFIFFSSPLLVFDARHDFLNTRNFITLFSTQNVIGNQSFFSRFLDVNQQFLFHALRLNISPLPAFILFLSLFILLWRYSIKNEFLRLHFLNIAFFTLLFSLLNSPRHPHYYGPLYYSFFLGLGYGFALLTKKNNLLIFLSAVFVIFFSIGLNIRYYPFLFNPPNNQIETARTIAQSILARKPKPPYQTIAIPHAETDGHIRYFLEAADRPPLPENSPAQPEELYVFCFTALCQIIGNPQWQIAAFQKATIASSWYSNGVTIYQLIHGK